MTDCKEFTDLHTGKKVKYSEKKVADLKAKYEAEGRKRVMLFKEHCVLGQIGEYKKFLNENGLAPAKKTATKSPAKKIAVKAAKKTPAKAAKSPAKKIAVKAAKKTPAKAAKKTPAKAAKKTPTKAAKKTPAKAAKSPAKKISVKTAKKTPAKKPAGKSPAKKISVKAAKKTTAAKKTPGKKSPAKKIAVNCIDTACPDDKVCRVKTGNCVAKKLAAEKEMTKKGRKFVYTTESQKAKVAEILSSAKKSSSAKKGKGRKRVSSMTSALSARPQAKTPSSLERREDYARAHSDDSELEEPSDESSESSSSESSSSESSSSESSSSESSSSESSDEFGSNISGTDTLSASDMAKLNETKGKIIDILKKCKQ